MCNVLIGLHFTRNTVYLLVHAAALHRAISRVFPMQPGSPSAPFKQMRIRVRSPTPQVAEQDVQEPHSCQAAITNASLDFLRQKK